MLYRKTIVAAIAILLFTSHGLFAQVLMPSKDLAKNNFLLNGNWKFQYHPSANIGADSNFYEQGFDISKWGIIKTPGNWELQGFDEPVYGRKVKDATGLYRTTFIVPTNWTNQPVYIAFDGICFGYSVWVNGQFAGEYASSFNRHIFNISGFVKAGKPNTLAVKVITHPKGWEFDTNDDWSLSGIIRDVTLFSLPPVHLQDVVVQTAVSASSATLSVKAIIEKSGTPDFPQKLNLSAQLIDPSGKLVNTFTLSENDKRQSAEAITFHQKITIEKPMLWNAETPNLYTLRLFLKDNTTDLQQYPEKVGIREISWGDGIFKVNGQPVKLRGATHHDLSPINGRVVSEAEMLKDLNLMYKANINFIRTSHYPPHPRLLELCDSLGFYVMDEVPYGFGDEHLEDSSYLPILLQRAKATIDRDKNHPGIIIWSVGNENPVTDIGLKTGRYVKRLDPTRPYCFPQTPTQFEGMLKAIPDSLDLLDDHYARVADLIRYLPQVDRPLLLSEYAHALGLDFNDMEAIYETLYAQAKFAGGAVWEFFDQGILRKAGKKIVKGEQTFFAWASADSLYDTGDNQGTDGVVYANRVPQVDYWQVRKVYTPVKASDDTFQYKPGKQEWKIRLNNRFDFKNLSAVSGQWQLYADKAIISSGTLSLKCNPHDSIVASINAVLPAKPSASFYYLKLIFKDEKGYQFYEKTYPIKQKENSTILNNIFTASQSKPIKKDNSIITNTYQFELAKDGQGYQLKNKTGNVLIAAGPYARVGRKPTIAQDATTTSRRSKVKHTIASQYLLEKSTATIQRFNAKELLVQYDYKPDSLQQSFVTGSVRYQFSDSGFINVNYQLTPSGKEDATEAGLSFLLPSSLTEFHWVGKGPYEAYPGKDRLSEFGIHHLNYNDLYYAGNRQNVACAVFTDTKGNGFMLVANDANISVERTTKGIVVSHNSYVSGRFNKYEWPEDLYLFKDGNSINGSFTLVPLTPTIAAKLKNIFGDINQAEKAFHPFFHSYDQ